MREFFPLFLLVASPLHPQTVPPKHPRERQQQSIRQQVESAKRQARTAQPVSRDWFRQPWPPAPIDPVDPIRLPTGEPPATGSPGSCDPIPPGAIQPVVQRTASAFGVPAALLQAVMERESSYRPCAVSSKGALGLMQLMPDTARELGVTDPFDPEQNLAGGARLLRQLLTRYNGDLELVLSAYNAGANRVDREGGVPDIAETRQYVIEILKKLFY